MILSTHNARFHHMSEMSCWHSLISEQLYGLIIYSPSNDF